MALISAERILINGNILTMESGSPRATALAIKGDRILFVGNDRDALELKGVYTEIIDLDGRTAIPGLIESHAHPLIYAKQLLGVKCDGEATRSINNIIENLAEVVSRTPEGQWVIGWGWDDSKFAERRNLTRWDLDRVSPKNPVILSRGCGHIVVANSLALSMSNITRDTQDPFGGHIAKDPDTGEPTGILQEDAQKLLPVISYGVSEYKRGMALAQQEFHRRGITTVNDMTAQPDGMRIYQQILKEGHLQTRIRMWPTADTVTIFKGMLDGLSELGFESGFGSDMINIQGIKFVLDGSMAGKTAAIDGLYEGETEQLGILYYTQEDLNRRVLKCFESGFRVSVHGIGQRAIEQALNAIEEAENKTGFVGKRNKIEHCSVPNDDQIERIKKLDIVVGSSIGFIYFIGGAYYYNLGQERINKAFPQRTYIDKGICAPGNSDCPVCDINPMWGIYGAVTRNTMSGHNMGMDECITPMEALRAYTIDAAYSNYDEGIIGSLKEGKYADIAVLDQDPTKIDPEQLKDITVAITIMNGEVVYKV